MKCFSLKICVAMAFLKFSESEMKQFLRVSLMISMGLITASSNLKTVLHYLPYSFYYTRFQLNVYTTHAHVHYKVFFLIKVLKHPLSTTCRVDS